MRIFSLSSRANILSIILAGLAIANPGLAAGREKAIHTFPPLGTSKAAHYPLANVVFDGAGNLYGTASQGGALNAGVVFQLSPASGSWSYHVIYTFRGKRLDGSKPEAGLILDEAGNLYGTTYSDGKYGLGTVFELSPSDSGEWTETILYDFGVYANDGSFPASGLIFDEEGNLYGLTSAGGSYGRGIAFELSPASGLWTETVLHTFEGSPTDGDTPVGALIFDNVGNLYGATEKGSESCNCGTVFELSPSSGDTWTESQLYVFQGGTDGDGPGAGPVFDTLGNLYGTTTGGGSGQNGTVFELVQSSGTWIKTTIHNFQPKSGDGADPMAALTLDAFGNIWGTTADGGAFKSGTVFMLSPKSGGGWSESGYSFTGLKDGATPVASVIFDSSGNVYGTTEFGGTGTGVVFEIKP